MINIKVLVLQELCYFFIFIFIHIYSFKIFFIFLALVLRELYRNLKMIFENITLNNPLRMFRY